jgi:hypothetical protein
MPFLGEALWENSGGRASCRAGCQEDPHTERLAGTLAGFRGKSPTEPLSPG